MQKFTRNQRLLCAADFQVVFNQVNAKASSHTLSLLATRNALGRPRIGFIVAKKQVRTAVQRNRIKRVIREYFRARAHSLPACDIVVLVRKGFEQLPNAEIKTVFNDQINRLSTRLMSGKGPLANA